MVVLAADEMGLGKTISILALILANPAPDEDLTLPQHKQQSAAEGAGAAMSSRQAALQSTEPIVTKPGERLPVLESTTGSSRQTAARSGGGTAGAGNKPDKQGSKGKQAGNKGKKRDWTAADSGAHEADAEDSAAADADTAAPAAAAAEGSTRGRGWGRGRGRGKGKGRGSAANLPRPAVAVAAMQHLMQGNVKEAMEDIAKLEAVESAELDAAVALPSTVGTGLLYSRATLVVCAVSLVGQWMDEAMDKTQASGLSELISCCAAVTNSDTKSAVACQQQTTYMLSSTLCNISTSQINHVGHDGRVFVLCNSKLPLCSAPSQTVFDVCITICRDVSESSNIMGPAGTRLHCGSWQQTLM